MKAIQTEYKGVLYRSRLEARWAVLFNELNIEYVYEPECFMLSNGKKYTPDFYIPKFDLYVEIKPNLDWLDNEYHMGRYSLFTKKFIVLSGSYPNFNAGSLFGFNYDDPVVFCPNSKYEPFFHTGAKLGEEESLFKDSYKKELQAVRNYRFYK